MEQVRLWPINSLPVPFPIIFKETVGEEQLEPQVDVDDNFSKGRVHKYFPNQGLGFMRDKIGREIVFKLSEMEVVGPKGKEHLREGAAVGYDLVHCGKVLHVKKMKIY